jgi:hypothetical protein
MAADEPQKLAAVAALLIMLRVAQGFAPAIGALDSAATAVVEPTSIAPAMMAPIIRLPIFRLPLRLGYPDATS